MSDATTFTPKAKKTFKAPAIPEPGSSPAELLATVRALKEAVELLLGQTAGGAGQAVRFRDLAAVVGAPAEQVVQAASTGDAIINHMLASADDELYQLINIDIANTRTALEQAQALMASELGDLINQETLTREVADQEIELRIDQVEADVGENTAAITQEAIARATQDSALAGQITTVNGRVANAEALISDEALIRAQADQAIVGQINTVSAQVANNTASITNEAAARAAADSSLADQISTLTTRVTNAEAEIDQEAIARANGDGALSAQLTTVSARANAGSASGFYRLVAVAPSLGGVAAEFAVQVSADGATFSNAGMSIQVMGNGTSRIMLTANQFIFNNGVTPFSISGSDITFLGKITANALSVSQLSSLSSNLGVIIAGYMASPDGKMQIDLNNGFILISD